MLWRCVPCNWTKWNLKLNSKNNQQQPTTFFSTQWKSVEQKNHFAQSKKSILCQFWTREIKRKEARKETKIHLIETVRKNLIETVRIRFNSDNIVWNCVNRHKLMFFSLFICFSSPPRINWINSNEYCCCCCAQHLHWTLLTDTYRISVRDYKSSDICVRHD